MAFATKEDVKRILNIPAADTSRDAYIIASLESAEEWVSKKLRRTYTAGSQTFTFYNVRDDAVINLPEDGTVDAVSDVDGFDLTFQPAGPGRIRLTGGLSNLSTFTSPPVLHNYLTSVDVEMTTVDTVPAPVREATALIAAEYVADPATEGGEIIAETIGDYAYKKAQADPGGVSERWAKAMILLRPYLRKRVAVI